MAISASLVKELRERTGAGMMDCKKALEETGGDIEQAVESLRKAGQAKADKKAGRIAADGRVAIAVSDDRRVATIVEVNCETDFVAKGDEFGGFAQGLADRALALNVDSLDALLAAPAEQGASQSVAEQCRELSVRIGEKIDVRRVQRLASASGQISAYVHGQRIGTLVDLAGGNDELGKDLAMHVAALKPEALDESEVPAERVAKEKEILLAQVADSGKPPEIQEKMIQGRLAKFLKEVTLLGQPFVKAPDSTVEKLLKSHGAKVSAFLRYEVGEGIERKQEDFAQEVMSQVRGKS